MHWPRGQKVIG